VNGFAAVELESEVSKVVVVVCELDRLLVLIVDVVLWIWVVVLVVGSVRRGWEGEAGGLERII
jgi:hypothetical protein